MQRWLLAILITNHSDFSLNVLIPVINMSLFPLVLVLLLIFHVRWLISWNWELFLTVDLGKLSRFWRHALVFAVADVLLSCLVLSYILLLYGLLISVVLIFINQYSFSVQIINVVWMILSFKLLVYNWVTYLLAYIFS